MWLFYNLSLISVGREDAWWPLFEEPEERWHHPAPEAGLLHLWPALWASQVKKWKPESAQYQNTFWACIQFFCLTVLLTGVVSAVPTAVRRVLVCSSTFLMATLRRCQQPDPRKRARLRLLTTQWVFSKGFAIIHQLFLYERHLLFNSNHKVIRISVLWYLHWVY